MLAAARRHGYTVILTADHGNIEDDTPSHSSNDVLTTVALPDGRCTFAERDTFQARLFDVSWTAATILGLRDDFAAALFKHTSAKPSDRFTGRSIID